MKDYAKRPAFMGKKPSGPAVTRQMIRQRNEPQCGIPPEYQHYEVSGWGVLAVVLILIVVGFIAGIA